MAAFHGACGVEEAIGGVEARLSGDAMSARQRVRLHWRDILRHVPFLSFGEAVCRLPITPLTFTGGTAMRISPGFRAVSCEGVKSKKRMPPFGGIRI